MRSKVITEEVFKEYKELISKGLSQRKACRALDISRGAIQNYLNNLGVNSKLLPKQCTALTNSAFYNYSDKPKVLFYDLETTLSKSYHFQVWGVNLGVKQQIQEGFLLSHAWAWNDGKVMGSILSSEEVLNADPERLVLEAWSLLDNADVVVAHYGKKFDIPTLNGYFLKYGLPKPSPYKVIDTKQISSKNFKLPFNSLEYLAKTLGVTQKIQNEGIQLWIDCDQGKQEALDTMLEYNMGDITSLRDIYYKMIGWDNNGANLALYSDHGALCPHCSSDDVKVLDGKYSHTVSRKYQAYRCNNCGAVLRSTIAEGVKNSLVRVV